MRCPVCKTNLVKGELRKYETLSEHVSDPNRVDVPLRLTYVCPNKCQGEGFFNPNGDLYGGNFGNREGWVALDIAEGRKESK